MPGVLGKGVSIFCSGSHSRIHHGYGNIKCEPMVATLIEVNEGDFALVEKEIPGLRIPVRGKAVWHLATGELPYADLEIVEVAYNLT